MSDSQTDLDNMIPNVKQNVDQAQQDKQQSRRLSDQLKRGAVAASDRDVQGTKDFNATGFSTSGAKFDETFGGSALTETGFKEKAGKQE